MIGIAVLGAGRIGAIHAANVAGNKQARLIAVADAIGDAAAILAARMGSEPMIDCEAAIARQDVDAVVIATPTNTHVDLMLKAVVLGKAVLCEKPIDLDIGKSQMAADQVERHEGRVMLAFNRRFDSTFAAMKLAIDQGEIGLVRQVVITSRDPGMPSAEYVRHSGGIFRDMTIHDLDIGRWLLGEEPMEVSAVASRLIAPELVELGDYDTAMVSLKTATGKQCFINNCREAVYGYDQRVEVLGSTGMLTMDNLRPTTIRRWSATATDSREPLLNFFLQRYEQAYRSELGAFVDAVSQKAPMPVTVQDGLKALRLAECAQEAASSGRVVIV